MYLVELKVRSERNSDGGALGLEPRKMAPEPIIER
jgi:hypothetical protein